MIFLKITKISIGLAVFIGILFISFLSACGDNTPVTNKEIAVAPTPLTSSSISASAPTTATQVVWSPDGKKFATLSRNGIISIRNANGNLVGNTESLAGTTTVVWSSNNKYLAVGGTDGVPLLIDAQAHIFGELKWGFAGTVTSLAWSPDNTRLAAAFSGQVLRMWKTEDQISNTDRGLQGISLVNEVSHFAYPITGLSWSPNSAILAVGTDGQGVQLLDKDGKTIPSGS